MGVFGVTVQANIPVRFQIKMTFTFTKHHDPLPLPQGCLFSRSVGDNSIDRRSGCPVDQGLFGGKKIETRQRSWKKYHVKRGFSIWNFRMIEGVWYTMFMVALHIFFWSIADLVGAWAFPRLWEVMVGPTVFQKFRLKICGVTWWWMVKTWMWRSKSCNLHYKFIQSQLVQEVIHQLYLIVSGGFKMLPPFLSLEMHQGLIMKVYIDTR